MSLIMCKVCGKETVAKDKLCFECECKFWSLKRVE
jgi:hypothetical protein